ncbi:169529b8-d927-47b7-9f27-ac7ac4464829 [Sclerotinia trifoliorum]|uniref:DNA 3'-5' helicase n=1 Tax=Sclerotinia trifoliorum TaxID=28548 RepID=A0A8H2ZNZ6_9HELO|nr:169529b8-d927-47b7-9f27-ac7ac4464829 [Sclerotinia trifoliorum]
MQAQATEMTIDNLLTGLNASQRAAVSSQADTLAILAGPGSGKTHTLTSRTAWLLQQGLQPWNIIVATFTVKAAREMKERIGKLIGNGTESKLILGTFHSIARRYLARYGHLIGIRKDFGIADSSDSLAIIKRIVKRKNLNIDPKVARSRISSLKAKGPASASKPFDAKEKTVDAQEFEIVHAEYQETLERSNLLDYDDLLVRCVELLRLHPSCVSNIEAVLIDEFQDTNLVQFDLMRLLAAYQKRITIVGDPDQSIYSFRAAEIKNYKRMLRQYPDTVTISLEENYRSSGAILLTALNVIEQDSSRIAKSLLPTHIVGTRPVLRKLATAQKEAEWIIQEIQRTMGMTGDLLDLNDFAILLRSSSLSRVIESSLGKAGIAYRMVGGLRFYDRVEIKTLLDYLRVINLPDNNDALARIINTPSRRIGETTIKSLLEEAEQSKLTLWALILDSVQGRCRTKTKLTTSVGKGLSVFVDIILTGMKKIADSLNRENSIVKIMEFIIEKISYEKWLELHHDDIHKARWDNVKELLAQATDFQGLISNGYEDDSLPQIDGLEQEGASDSLTRFLANVALASEVKKEDDQGSSTPQITISTIHAAKGLEWPIVFIPGAYQGSIPHSRAEDTDEERRLLYVAMTRAKALLNMSCPLKNSLDEFTATCPFLSARGLRAHLDKKGPPLRSNTVQCLAQILRRTFPTKESIAESSACLELTEDTYYPLEPEDDKQDESKWNLRNGNPYFTKDQRPPKRRRLDTKDQMGNVSGVFYNNTPMTTMERVSNFTLGGGFVSAGSHLQVLGEQSSNQTIGEMRSTSTKGTVPCSKNSFKGPPNGQGTLLGFLGKQEPKKEIKPAPIVDEFRETNIRASAQLHRHRNNTAVGMMQSPSQNEDETLPPLLTGHRLGTGAALPRPSINRIQGEQNDSYIFLSSSPPRAKQPSIDTEPAPDVPVPGLTAKPAIMSLVRPARTLHTTSMAIAQGSGSVKKTLGVKRSMNGWGSRTTQPFVPPTRKREN